MKTLKNENMKKCFLLIFIFSSFHLFICEAQSPYLTKNLTPEQVAEYKKAVEAETAVVPLVEEYLELRERLEELDSAISQTWEAAFDSKSYLYNLLMDKSGNGEMLRLYEQKLNAVRAAQAELRDGLEVPAVDNYLLQKRLLMEYEVALAQELGKTFATPAQVDTLRARLMRLPQMKNKE